jgi:hypothetical protein
MQLADMILISIDDHVIEPSDIFVGHVPAKYADRAPKVVRGPDGTEQWKFQDVVAGNLGSTSTVATVTTRTRCGWATTSAASSRARSSVSTRWPAT